MGTKIKVGMYNGGYVTFIKYWFIYLSSNFILDFKRLEIIFDFSSTLVFLEMERDINKFIKEFLRMFNQ